MNPIAKNINQMPGAFQVPVPPVWSFPPATLIGMLLPGQDLALDAACGFRVIGFVRDREGEGGTLTVRLLGDFPQVLQMITRLTGFAVTVERERRTNRQTDGLAERRAHRR